MARTLFMPTPAQRMQVEIATACGLPHAHICERIINPQTGNPIDEKTLRRAFRVDINRGTVTANAAVAQNLFKQATGKGPCAVAAARFWLQCRAGWRPAESLAVTHSGAVGGVDLSAWVSEEARERAAKEILRHSGYEFDE